MEVSFKGGQEAKKHNPPTKIKNAGIFRPFEFFVDMYGMPNYNELIQLHSLQLHTPFCLVLCLVTLDKDLVSQLLVS